MRERGREREDMVILVVSRAVGHGNTGSQWSSRTW